MTRNNLASHLAWFLSDVQLTRPTVPELPTAHDAFDTSRSFTSLSSQPVAPASHTRSDAPVPNASSSASTSRTSPRVVEDADLTLYDDLFSEEEGDRLGENTAVRAAGMARLTTKPSRKPSLMSKQEQLPTPPTTGVGKLQQAYSASLSQNDSAARHAASQRTKQSKGRTPSWIMRPSEPARREVTPGTPDDNDEGLLDLTEAGDLDPDATASTEYGFASPNLLWTAEHARRPEPPPSRGKKRKSSEMLEPSPKPKPASRSKAKQVVKEEDEDDFPDIVDLVDDDLVTPAMRRRHAAFSSPRKSPPKLHISASDTTVLTQRTVTQTVSRTETTIRRTASADQTPRLCSSQGADEVDSPLGKGKGAMPPPPPQSARRPGASSPVKPPPKQPSPSHVAKDEDFMSDGGIFEPQSPSPRPSRKFKCSDVIMDSDDEFESFTTPPTRNVSNMSFVTAADGTASGSKRKRTSPAPAKEGSTKFAIDSPSKRQPALLDAERSQQNCTLIDHVDLDAMEVDVDEQQDPEASTPERENPSSESEYGTLIMDLFKQQPHILDVLHKLVSDCINENSAVYKRSLLEGWPLERKAQVKREKQPLSQRQKAILAAKAAHEAYSRLDAKRQELVAQITMAYDADEDIEEAEASLEELNEEMRRGECTLKEALVAAGVNAGSFNDLPDPPPHPTQQRKSATSVAQPTNVTLPPSLSRESSFIPECVSQNFQQPQGASRPSSRVVSFEQPQASFRPPALSFSSAEMRSSRPAENRRSVNPPRAPVEDHEMEDLLDDDDDEMWMQPDVFQPKPRVQPASKSVAHARPRSPIRSKRHQDNFSDYGDGDEDMAAMVAMAEEAEDFDLQHASHSNRRARSVLSESSGNAAPAARLKAAAKKPAKPVPKLRINPELMQHPWSKDVLKAFKDRFRLEGFRTNQLEAINATLAGQDAFVLMPTGGGKSLCYQLPAVVNSGRTRGVTIVVTPLLSLMQDQVDHLTARGIIAKSFNGDMDRHKKQDILQSFKLKNPEHHVQLLYVTPEMINKSTAFLDGLRTLHRNKKFARLVIDEAHCVSQWGHDFRPDYKELGQIRLQFPGVPIIALTATATNNVIVDIKHNLKMEQCKVFSQSFNRPNLYYEVRPKEKQPVEKIAELINEKYGSMTGIVYTLSRKQTEQIAQKLRDYGIDAEHYHAAMAPEEKTRVQRDWQSGGTKVVVATIAFGMGIDKPDVRFVIHHYLPKSLEGYYQETGRAGRDGLPSDCYLFFSHGDIYQLKKFIDESDGSRAQKERQKEMLNRVVMFCENRRDCRRSQLLHYFGETFSKEQCGATCDNCKIGGHFEVEDRTEYAQAVLQAVMHYSRLTMIQCTDILSGKKKPDRDEEPQPFHGIAKDLTRYETNQIITNLAMHHALGEENKVGGGGIAISYFILGSEAASYLYGGRRLKMVVRQGGDKKAAAKTTKKKATKKSASEDTMPVSTCISSPVRGGARRTKKGKSVASFFDEEAIAEGGEDGDVDPRALHANGYEQDGFVVDDDDEDDYFDPPVPPPHKPRKQRTLDKLASSKSKLSAEPIDEMQELLVPEYMREAKLLEEETRNNRGLRRVLFSEAQMKQMMINWTDTLEKMKRIPGTDVDKVTKYGARFLPLINKYHDTYRSFLGTDVDAMATIPATAGPSTNRRKLPQPPGDVIDLLSEDDEDEDGAYDDPGVPSKYFGAKGQDDPLQSQLEGWQERFAATSQIEEPVSRGRGSSSKGAGGGKRNYYRKGGGGSRGGSKSYSGVSKRKGSTSSAGGNRRTSGGSARSGASKSTASTVKRGGVGRIPHMPY